MVSSMCVPVCTFLSLTSRVVKNDESTLRFTGVLPSLMVDILYEMGMTPGEKYG